MDSKKTRGISGATFLTFLIIVFFAMWLMNRVQTRDNEMTYTQFVQNVENEKVDAVTITQNKTVPTGILNVSLKKSTDVKTVFVSDVNTVQDLLVDNHIDYKMSNV